MIVGIGTDLTEISRVERILEDASGERFMRRVLTPAEFELASGRKGRRPEFVAGRFAAKEAVAKALGCGIGRQVGLQDIEVLPDASGKPVCTLSAEAWSRLGKEVGLRIHLSITHTSETAAAFAVVEEVR